MKNERFIDALHHEVMESTGDIQLKNAVIPAKAGSQCLHYLLDAPGLQIAGAGSSSPT
jgi:hypothetical protein